MVPSKTIISGKPWVENMSRSNSIVTVKLDASLINWTSVHLDLESTRMRKWFIHYNLVHNYVKYHPILELLVKFSGQEHILEKFSPFVWCLCQCYSNNNVAASCFIFKISTCVWCSSWTQFLLMYWIESPEFSQR